MALQGKSLSIICAAIRWLKDHKERERNDLVDRIQLLEQEKGNSQKDCSDWISAQAEEIEINKKLAKLKIESGCIAAYDKKIQTLTNKKKQIKQNKYIQLKPNEIPFEQNSEGKEDDDDLLLDDLVPNLQDLDHDSSDEEGENKYAPVKVSYAFDLKYVLFFFVF